MPTKPPSYMDIYKIIARSYARSNYELYRGLVERVLVEIGAMPGEALHQDPVILELNQAYQRVLRASEPFTDILGPLYMEVASHGGRQHMGQYFTPQNIAQMMAEIAVDDVALAAAGKLRKIGDPACGSGVMVLCYAQAVMRRGGPESLKDWMFYGNDLDYLCSITCATQLLANMAVFNLEAGEILVTRGDALSADQRYKVIAHAVGKSRAAETSPAARICA